MPKKSDHQEPSPSKKYGPGILAVLKVMEMINSCEEISTRELIKKCEKEKISQHYFYIVVEFLESFGLLRGKDKLTKERGKGRIKVYELTPRGAGLYRVLREYFSNR